MVRSITFVRRIMALIIKLPKSIKGMMPSLAGVSVGLLILLFVQGQSLLGWIQGEPDAIQKSNYQSCFIGVKEETKVIMFGAKWCQYCAKAREYLIYLILTMMLRLQKTLWRYSINLKASLTP